ncbi:hypothetical protein [Sphingomonas antarctica]|uniref:hypothetical protein n=1 Tax=Sphingomonas antarctica TaxID=2040274 RepID=UPI0039E90B86
MTWKTTAQSIFAASFLASCGSLFGESYTYRYRMTVEVDTPKGLRTGTSVIENTETEGRGIPDNSLHLSRRGQAVLVDLPNGRTLVVTLKTAGGFDGAFAKAAYNPVLPSHDVPDDWSARNKALTQLTAPAILPSSAYPMMVTFRDNRNPTTVEAVDPANLGRKFGSGYQLRRIVIQMTNDSVTTGIKTRFAWLSHLSVFVRRDDQHLWPNNPERNLGKSAFVVGV